jgi:hypothetical protein
MADILLLPFENRTGLFSLASLGHFSIKNILFMTLFFIKWSRLSPTIRNPDYLSGFQMVETKWPTNLAAILF